MNARRLFPHLGILWLLLPLGALAQRAEIWREKPGTWLLNVGLGVSHYEGDINEPGDIIHLGAALNLAATYRFSQQFSFRAEAQLYYIYGDQKFTHISYNNLSFHSLNPDAWVGLQWDVWPVDDKHRTIIPYVLAGAGLTYITPKATYQGQSYSLAPLHTEGVTYSRLPVIVRYGAGMPLLATERFKFNVEAAYTHVFSDYLDDVSTVYPDRSGMSPLAAALSDRKPEIGGKPNPPGSSGAIQLKTMAIFC